MMDWQTDIKPNSTCNIPIKQLSYTILTKAFEGESELERQAKERERDFDRDKVDQVPKFGGKSCLADCIVMQSKENFYKQTEKERKK